MADKKEEWGLDYSKEHSPVKSETKTINFTQSESLVGSQLDGRFLIEKDLTEGGADEGGIGLVYLAKDMKLLGKQVVVKILQKSALKSDDMRRKFQHEKEALIRLDHHPNIVHILDSGTLSDGNPFLVMEFIVGYSLRRVLAEKKILPFDYCARIIESVGNALNAAHSEKILHRDIKPENIMLTPQEDGTEHLRLIDFGIAKVADSILAPATAIPRGIGTVLYMAPEQLAAKSDQTPAADIYPFGLVVYELLTGQLPFKPNSVVEMFELQKNGVQKLPRNLRTDLSENAERILLSALEFEPALRPQNALEFGRRLAEALRESPVAVTTQHNLEMAKTLPSSLPLKSALVIAPTQPSFNENNEKQSAFSISQIQTPPRKSSRKFLWLGLLGLLAVLSSIAGIIGLVYWKNNSGLNENRTQITQKPPEITTTKTSATPEVKSISKNRQFTYFLNVQKMRDQKPLDAPFESSGREIFENGYKFQMNFRSVDEGYFYLFNEGKDTDGRTNYNILYPIPLPAKDKALTEKDKFIQTEWNIFGGKAESEKVWLIWTKNKQTSLEDAVKEAFEQKGRVANREKEEALRKFIEENSKQKINAELEKDETKKRMNFTGESDIIAYLIELEHR